MNSTMDTLMEVHIDFFWACSDTIPFGAEGHALDECAMYMAGGEL